MKALETIAESLNRNGVKYTCLYGWSNYPGFNPDFPLFLLGDRNRIINVIRDAGILVTKTDAIKGNFEYEISSAKIRAFILPVRQKVFNDAFETEIVTNSAPLIPASQDSIKIPYNYCHLESMIFLDELYGIINTHEFDLVCKSRLKERLPRVKAKTKLPCIRA